MKYVVASDIHGSARFCRLLKERYSEERADKLLLLGDLLYHGARNPLPEEYSTLKCAEILNSIKDELLCARGNCDSEVDQMVLEFPVFAEFFLLPLCGRTAIFTHGHREIAAMRREDILFNGHFHVPAFEQRETCLYVNCGSVSIPKEGSPHSYLVIEDDVLLFKDVVSGAVFRKERLTAAGQ